MKKAKARADDTVSEPVVNSSSLTANLTTLWGFLLKGRGRQIVFLVVLMLMSALMEMATLAAAVPLVSALLDSQGNGAVSFARQLPLPDLIKQADNPYTFILAGVILIVCTGALVRILVIRKTADFSAAVGVELQTLYLRGLLNRDYEKAINQSSSKKISLITQKIQFVISSYILGILTALTAIVSSIAVVSILIYLGTPVVFLALMVLVLGYLIIAWFSRSKLKFYGQQMRIYNPRKIQCVQESLGGIRDVGMAGSQEVFVQRLGELAQKTETATARLNFYNAFPRPLLEAIGITTIALIAWVSFSGVFTFDNLLPMLGVFTLGMLRLLPYIQAIFGQWTKIFNGQQILAEFITEMDNFVMTGEPVLKLARQLEMDYRHSIELVDVGFSYQGTHGPVLTGLNLTINKGEFIGIVGPTGSGKSTVVDILMGLLPPTRGTVLIDGAPLHDANRAAWRRRVAHVPQKIFLTQGTMAENIAFSVQDDQMDWERIHRCAAQAHIDEYIRTLPEGYDTRVGEDGTRLSGGQRQRIGIARALYSHCDVLVFDEATNALDAATEKAVLAGILQLEHEYTIIMVAHNLQAVEHCHRKLVVENGNVRWSSL